MGRVLAIVLFFWSSLSLAQKSQVPLFVSNGVFVQDTTIAAVLDMWHHYLDSRPDSVYDNPYWNEAEKHRYKTFDLSSNVFSASLYIAAETYKPTVLSITKDGTYYKIRTLYAMMTDSGFSDPLEIQEVYAKKEGGAFKLYNALAIKTQAWGHETIESITFIFPPYHKFDRALAVKMSHFADSLARLTDRTPIPIDFYFADRLDELKKARGLDYEMGEGNSGGTEGQAWPEERIVLGGGGSEWYPHEFVHVYFKLQNNYFNEGIATMLGSSRGQSLPQLIRHGDSLLSHDPSIRFDTLLYHPYQGDLDYKTGVDYLVGGLLVQMVYDKGGWPLVKQLSKYQYGPEGLLKAVNDVFGVSKQQYDSFIKQKIKEYARGSEHKLKK